MMNPDSAGLVFDIQKFSLHDGPGIRDLVFFKGCPLSCRWCSNPESQSMAPELFLRRDRCLGTDACRLCVEACPANAVAGNRDGGITIDRSLCDGCGRCTAICPSAALRLVGRRMTVAELLAVVEKDSGFHFRSGGGITLSGGEPLAQAAFAAALLSACRRQGIHTAVETAGHGGWERLERVARHADLIFFDLKSLDDHRHKNATGVSNRTIKQNLRRLALRFPKTPLVVRTPVIPGFNDNRTAIADIADYLKGIGTLQRYELMALHRFGWSKYSYLDRKCALADIEPPGEDRMRVLRRVAEQVVGVKTDAA